MQPVLEVAVAIGRGAGLVRGQRQYTLVLRVRGPAAAVLLATRGAIGRDTVDHLAAARAHFGDDALVHGVAVLRTRTRVQQHALVHGAAGGLAGHEATVPHRC